MGELAGRGRGAKFVLNVIWNSIGVIASLAAGLLLSPYLIRKLGPDGYGVWALSFALIEYYWLLDLGFRSAAVKYVAHYWTLREGAKISEVVSTALLYSSGAAAIIITIILSLAPSLQTLFQIAPAYQQTFVRLIMIVSVSWCFSIVFGVFGAVLEAVQRFDLSMRATIAGTVARTSGTFILLYLGYGLIEIGILAALSQALSFFFQYRSFRRVFGGQEIGPRYASIAMLKQMMGFGVHTFFITVSQQFLTQSAPLLIGHFHSAMFVGFYALPVRLLQYTVEMVSRIGIVTNTNAAEMSARSDHRALGELAVYSNRYSLVLFMPMAIFLATQGEALFQRWVGPDFAKYSAPVLPVLLMGYVLAIVGQFSSTMLLQGLAKHRVYARGLIVEALLGIIAMWLAIPAYGVLGAAWVSSIIMIANRCLFTSWLTSRVIGMSFVGFIVAIYGRPLLAAIPVFGLAWWLRAFLPGLSWAQLAEAGLLISIAYYGTAFFLVISEAHRTIVIGWAERLVTFGQRHG